MVYLADRVHLAAHGGVVPLGPPVGARQNDLIMCVCVCVCVCVCAADHGGVQGRRRGH